MTERVLIFAMGVLAGFLLMLFVTADAEAFTPASSPYMERYERVATSYWGGVPDCGQVEYLWPEEDPFGNEDALAYAEVGGCRMWLVYWEPLKGMAVDRSYAYALNCAIFTHEWGHLLGFEHDAAGYRTSKLYDACDAAAKARYPNARVLKAAKPKRKRARRVARAHSFDDAGSR